MISSTDTLSDREAEFWICYERIKAKPPAAEVRELAAYRPRYQPEPLLLRELA